MHWLEELGIAQAMLGLEVVNLGPFLVESDLEGNSLFECANRGVNENPERLYASLRLAATAKRPHRAMKTFEYRFAARNEYLGSE